jgi:hypothetical protein
MEGAGPYSPYTGLRGRPWFDVTRYGAKGDGSTDDSAAIQAACTAAVVLGGVVFFPGGKTYLIGSQVTLALSSTQKTSVYGFGAELITTGAISALKITGGGVAGATIFGLKVNHRGNATATAGFELVGTRHVTLRDCEVEAHGVSASYAACWLHNTDPNDDNTGSYWTTIENFQVRKRSGSDVGDITYGILAQGASNATRISGGELANVVTGVCITTESGKTTVPGSISINGTWFETFTTGIKIDGAVGSDLAGLRVLFCRFETGTTGILYGSTTTTQPSNPMFTAGNVFASSVTTHISNPNTLFLSSLEACITPNDDWDVKSGNFSWGLRDASSWFTISAVAGARGIRLMNSARTTVYAQLIRGAAANEAILGSTQGGVAGLKLQGLTGVDGSGGTVDRKNLRGTVTISNAATTGAVSFGSAEPDANYKVWLCVNSETGAPAAASRRCWVSGIGTGGFTVNLEAAPGAGTSVTVAWLLIG